MNLASAILENLQRAEAVEIVPAFLLPDESRSAGVCLVGDVLGISNKALAASYVTLCASGEDVATPAASLVAIIAAHENVRALNARKRMCLAGEQSPREELRITSILLGSHMQKHNKSPMLWYHRRWLLETFGLSTTLRGELAVVGKAAEYHPKNYYAWAHLRWYSRYANVRQSQQLFAELKTAIKSMCARNLGDVSMWSFLHWLDSPELEAFAVETDAEFPGHRAILPSVPA